MVIGIGTDIIEIRRIDKIIARFSTRFLKKVFTPRETGYCSNYRYPGSCYAGRFAAKEAILKALGTGLTRGNRWQDVEVIARRGEAPGVVLYGRTADLARERGVQKILLSISHDKTKAVAFALLIGGWS